MRKDVKRSLLLWPATASATITAISWILTTVNVSLPFGQTSVELPQVVVLNHEAEAIEPDCELSARSEHGTRAMTIPPRVAELLAARGGVVIAPRRDTQRELAGWVPDGDETRPAVTQPSILIGDLLASLALQAPVAFPEDEASDKATDAMPPLVGPTRPEFWEPEIPTLQPPTLAPPSMLPASVRALGKRVLVIPTHEVEPSSPVEERANRQETVTPPISAVSTTDVADVEIHDEKMPTTARPPLERNPAGWPVTQRLNEQLQALSILARNSTPASRDQLVSLSSSPSSPIIRWSQDVTATLAALRALPRLADPRAGELIDELSELATEGAERAEKLGHREQQIQWLCASYAISRRVAVWRPIWEAVRSGQTATMVRRNAAQPADMNQAMNAVRADLDATGDAAGWARYLLLDQLQESVSNDNVDQRVVLAQRFLSRLDWHGLDPLQRSWLQRDSVKRLSGAVRPWAQDAVDYVSLLGQIERQESDAIDLAAIDIAGAVQTLRFAENPLAVEIAESMNTYYRNANIRIALSQPMLQRFLPTVNPRSVPVRTQILGSQVRGTSRLESDLRVTLRPSPDRWLLDLHAAGNVRTRSTGLKGPVALRTSSRSRFVATTPIEVTRWGVQSGNADVDVRGRTRLRGIRTQYDGWPLIGSLVRRVAEDHYHQLAGRSNRVANRKMETQIADEIDCQLDRRLTQATETLSEIVLGPLGKLKLDPRVTDMETTDRRLLARYRLAGDWQLAAFTARPRAPRTSLMSVQVHQSALNNTLEQLVPRQQSLTIDEIIRRATATFGRSDLQLPEDLPEDVAVQFAPTRPITVEVEDGRLWLTLRIVRLSRGDRGELTKFIVRAAYKPQLEGMQATLIRDGHLRISGPGMSMRERLPVRAIFNKVLTPNRPLPLTLPRLVSHPAAEGLAVSQLELRGGWIGLAISEADAPRIALRRSREADY